MQFSRVFRTCEYVSLQSMESARYPQELRCGLAALEGSPVRLSLEDLDTLTEGRALCNPDGELDLPAFERLIRHQVSAFTLLTLALSLACLGPSHSNPVDGYG